MVNPLSDTPAASRDIRLHLGVALRAGGEIELSRDASHYLSTVMRTGKGETIYVFNGEDGEWLAELFEPHKRAARLRLIAQTRPPSLPPDLWLLFAPIKKARTDFIVEKACELGCRRVLPVITARTRSETVRLDRLQAHAVEAAEQWAAGVVANLAAQAQRAGVAEIGLGDTIGVATPWDVRRVIDRVRMEAPDVYLRLHFHDTRGAGLANVAAAVDAGVDVIDASCGGIGGCPFAPAATGNVATEDVVYMLERAGFETGLDLGKLIETAKWLESALGHTVSSSLSKAGGFPN